MTRTLVSIAVLSCALGPRALAQEDRVLLLAQDGDAWRRSLAELYAIEASVRPAPSGATQLLRDADAQRTARAHGATHALWIEGRVVRVVTANGAEARSMELLSGAHALARTSLLLVRGREPPRLARVSRFDLDVRCREALRLARVSDFDLDLRIRLERRRSARGWQ